MNDTPNVGTKRKKGSPPTEWAPRFVQNVAAQIKRYRNARGLTTAELADLCTELGLPIKRAVISNLELGYRETVTVPELLVFAAALNVPPTALMVPLDAKKAEPLAGVEVSPWAAHMWITGEGFPLVTQGQAARQSGERVADDWMEATQPARLYRHHDERLASWTMCVSARDEATMRQDRARKLLDRTHPDDAAVVAQASIEARDAATRIKEIDQEINRIVTAFPFIRAQLRALGCQLPALPPDLVYLDAVDDSRDALLRVGMMHMSH